MLLEIEESEGKYSGTNEPNWKANLLEDTSMNIDVMNQGKMIESMLPDVERSDTKSDLLVENHFVVTGQKDEIEGKHSGRKELDRKFNLSKDNNMNIDDMNQGDMVEGIQPDIKRLNTKIDLSIEIHSVGIIQGKWLKASTLK